MDKRICGSSVALLQTSIVSLVGGSVALGTNQILAPAETEPLHFTRFVVFTQCGA